MASRGSGGVVDLRSGELLPADPAKRIILKLWWRQPVRHRQPSLAEVS